MFCLPRIWSSLAPVALTTTTIMRASDTVTDTLRFLPSPLLRYLRSQCAAGTDPKSIAINLASTLLFIIPIVAYMYEMKETFIYIAVVAASFVLAYLIPPVGMLRPHPYSDMPSNRPRKTE